MLVHLVIVLVCLVWTISASVLMGFIYLAISAILVIRAVEAVQMLMDVLDAALVHLLVDSVVLMDALAVTLLDVLDA